MKYEAVNLTEAETAAQLSIPVIYAHLKQLCALQWLNGCVICSYKWQKKNITPLHEQVWQAVSFCELLMVLSRFTDCISTYWQVSNDDIIFFK